ncbi:unnamed protein product [Cylindrotheca closterium]|uniref:Leucine-rich repeat-containing N-terminal plant-type domain-containing protein n=1 Tax=Cylindrotheca closterium TaxID=2856 RepID=A0AAD2G4Z2_9STRA|nr:unnamed protein product [Cylindrotheca closterium]
MTDSINEEAPRQECSSDIERQSPPPTHSAPRFPFESNLRLDMTGSPVPLITEASPPTTPVMFLPITEGTSCDDTADSVSNDTADADNISLPSKLPKTPDTVMSRGDEEIKGDGHPSKLYEEEEGDDGSDSTSHAVIAAGNRKEKQWSLPPKCVMIAVLPVVFLVMLATTLYFLLGQGQQQGREATVPAAFYKERSTPQPTVFAPFETGVPSEAPSSRPTQGPTPTRVNVAPRPPTNRPTSDPTSRPTRNPTSSTSRPTQRPTPNNPTPRPTRLFEAPRPSAMTSRPTQRPTLGPSPNPTPRPTPNPTPSTTTNRPTQRPTPNPTPRPSPRPNPAPAPIEDIISDFLFKKNSDNNAVNPNDASVQKALRWLENEADAAQSIPFPLDQKYLQRFGILILYFSVAPNVQPSSSNKGRLPNLGMQNQDECSWTGMRCNGNGMLTRIKLSNRQFDGTLPAEWGFFPNLKSIDFSNNKLKGIIPQTIYGLSRIEELYLYKNQLSGSISSKIGNLWRLERFHLSHNKLEGSIPKSIASTLSRARKLRYFNVHRNQMTGTIPSNMRLRQLYTIDLGHNKFSGTLPPDFGTESIRLRHLMLDYNGFSGTFPSEVLNAGGGRLITLFVNDNKFSGTFPGDHDNTDSMSEMTIQNNNFVSMQRNATCQLDVFSGGELVEFKSDCLVCRCGFALMCRYCTL